MSELIIAYKLFNIRKDGSIGPLFINRRQRITVGVWLDAEDHPTKGYAHRPGWHCCRTPNAPHLSERGRQWFKVEIQDYQEVIRPESQGGVWYLANRIKILEKVLFRC